MAEELQSLLEKINNEGIKKAEAERDAILSDARKQAEEIIADAKKNASVIVESSKREAEALNARATAALKQAARDIVLQLRNDLQNRLAEAVQSAECAALTPEFMAELTVKLSEAFAADSNAQIQLRTAVKDLEKTDEALKKALANSFANAPKLFPGKEISSGMEVSFDGGKCYFDFTADAVTELVNSYIGEKLAAIFKAEK